MEPIRTGIARWFVLAINPEPWAVGPLDLGRRNGKVFATMGRNQQLAAFQNAVREEIGDGHEVLTGPMQLRFFFWRNREDYKLQTEAAHRRHIADVTNMQKALEDALQGVLFENDRDTNDVRSIVVEQGPEVKERIVLSIEPNIAFPPIDLPDPVWEALELLDKREDEPYRSSIDYGDGSEIF